MYQSLIFALKGKTTNNFRITIDKIKLMANH